MIIRFDNINNFYKENQNYNNDVRNFVSELLETNTTGRINYMVSVLDNFHLIRRHNYYRQQEREEYLKPQEDDKILENFAKYEGLGPLEFSLASYLLNPDLKYYVIVLTGALGSGKSCLSNYVLDYIKKSSFNTLDVLHFPKKGIIHKINFNDHQGQTTDEVISEFKLELINKLVALIEQIHRRELFIDKFLDAINNEDEQYAEFSEYARKIRNSHKITEESRFEQLLDWLHEFDEHLSYKLKRISQILSFIKKNKENGKKIDFILLLDNIDKLDDPAQIEILNIIFSFSIQAPTVKILVPMRLTTFGKIKGNGSFSFGVLQNTGQPPISIFEKRVTHFLTHQDEYNLTQKISAKWLPYFLKKINFIANCLADNPDLNRLTNFFTSISGNSIRRGLFLAERFFVNSTIYFEDSNLYQDEFLKALLVSENQNGRFLNDDRLVDNVFVGKGNINSLIQIRILQILESFRQSNYVCTINIIISQLNSFEEYSNDEIFYAINSLIFYPRRLAFIEGVNSYPNYDSIIQSVNDVIRITYSGIEYLETLIYNTVYLQNSFMICNWTATNATKDLRYLKNRVDRIANNLKNNQISYLQDLLRVRKIIITDFFPGAYNYRDIGERMKFLRDCLYFLMLNDLNQLSKYLGGYDVNEIDSIDSVYIKRSVIIDIIGKVSVNVLQILRKDLGNHPEIENWFSQLIVADLWHQNLFKIKNEYVDFAINLYKKEMSQFIGKK